MLDLSGLAGAAADSDPTMTDPTTTDLSPPSLPRPPDPDAADAVAAGYRAGFVALVGRPNVGKSTLLNAFVGEKVAIVSPKAQTTRRRVLGICTTPQAQAVFVDTPGLHDPATALGTFMVREARAALADADVLVWVVDAGRAPDAEDERLARPLRSAHRPVLIVMNKADTLLPEDVLARTAAYADLVRGAEWMLTIATRGHNLPKLWEMIVAGLPISPPLFPEDQLTDQNDRQFAAELVREAALKHLQQEVPHGVEVTIEEWTEQPNGVLHVAAKIIVERASHKSIAIGEGGAMIKKIGTTARRELERALDRRVFLELFVAVREGWRHDAGDVRRMGYR